MPPSPASRLDGSGSLRRDFRLGFRPMDLVYGLGAAVAGLIVADLVELAFSGTRYAGSNTQILNGARGNGAGFAVVTIIVAVGAPVVEELFFRGLIRTALAARLGPHGAIWGQAILFGLAHIGGAHGLGNVSLVVAIGSLGVILGYAAYLTGRLGAGMVAHSLFNLTAALTILLR
ncbi:MAG: CPBP family intramembrane glutamic endopeptidase [Acidimicrobiales bacterium]